MREISFQKDVLPLKDKLFRMALRLTLDRALAEDIVQETLIRAWNKRHEWQDLGSIEAYCTTICRNLALDEREKKDAQAQELTPEVENSLDPTSEPNPHDALVRSEQLLMVRKLMDQLPEKQRNIMELRDVEEKSYQEIAALLDISEEQVKVNLFRARQKVRQQFLKIEGYGL